MKDEEDENKTSDLEASPPASEEEEEEAFEEEEEEAEDEAPVLHEESRMPSLKPMRRGTSNSNSNSNEKDSNPPLSPLSLPQSSTLPSPHYGPEQPRIGT